MRLFICVCVWLEGGIKAADECICLEIKCLGVVTWNINSVRSNWRHILILHSNNRHRHATIAIQRDDIIELLEQPARINIIRS